MAKRRVLLFRLLLALCAALAAFVALPAWLATREADGPPLTGRLEQGDLFYAKATVGQVLRDIETRTNFRAVAFPGIANRSFAGRIPVNHGGRAAAAALASASGLRLRRAGPHWVLAEPSGAASTSP